MPSLSSRKQVSATASGRKVYAKFQQLSGTPNGQGGFTGGGTWSDVPGLTNVPVTFRTWSPYEKFMAQQIYPSVSSRAYMRWRRGVNIAPNMRLMYGNHEYFIRGVSNYDEANTDIILYLEEVQASGTVRQA
jgi:hypothetical protein